MSINTSLMDIIQSELINLGINEFFNDNDNQLVLFNEDHIFIKKVINYDEDVEFIVNNRFFYGLTLDDPDHDRKFKRQFISKFLDHRPKFQTVEAFASEVVFRFMNNMDFLNEYYNNITDYTRGKQDNTNLGNENRLTDNRHAQATLPQTEVNVNVDDTILDYADRNDITRIREMIERENTDDNYNYDLDTLIKSRNLLNEVFEDFERNCFLQIW